ncbi:MAG: molybdate ABC transporter substrate-binding protein [Chloroflexi bacterium]|nr:molybdate ABC transporter substrate-binding protein [Chloroflexota bacterium]
MKRRIGLWLPAILGALVVGCGGGGENDSILVAAAASLTDALVEAGEAFESRTGIEVAFSFGGSNALARQVELGAPADAVIFAGAAPMDRLEASGHIDAGTRSNLLRNRLVLIGDKGAAPLAALRDLASTRGRIALADPALAPAGLYAKQALETSGLWDGLQSRVIPTLDVRAAVGAVDTGSVAFGLVYATDAANASGVVVVFEVPETLHDPIVYPAAVVNEADGAVAAQMFLEFLLSDDGRAVLERHGFAPVTE